MKAHIHVDFEEITDKETGRPKPWITDKHQGLQDRDRERYGAQPFSMVTKLNIDTYRISELVIKALQAEGLEPVRTQEFENLFANGATMEKFIEAARIARQRGKGFNYLLAIVKNDLNQPTQQALAENTAPNSLPTLATKRNSKKEKLARYAVVLRDEV